MSDVELHVSVLSSVPSVNHLLDVVGLGEVDGESKHMAFWDSSYTPDVL